MWPKSAKYFQITRPWGGPALWEKYPRFCSPRLNQSLSPSGSLHLSMSFLIFLSTILSSSQNSEPPSQTLTMFLSHHLAVTLKHSISFTMYSQHLYPSQYLVLSVSLTISHPLSYLPPNLHVFLSSPFLPFSLTSTDLPTSLSLSHTHIAVDLALKSLQPQRHICVCTS